MTSEIISIVDDNDTVIGEMPRPEAHAGGFNVRIACVIVFTSDKKIVPARISLSRSYFPGCWTYSAAGHVNKGEDYRDAAARELGEEMGIHVSSDKLNLIGKYRTICEKSGKNRHFFTVYSVINDGPYTPDPDETSEIKAFSIDEIIADINNNPDDYLEMFRRIILNGDGLPK